MAMVWVRMDEMIHHDTWDELTIRPVSHVDHSKTLYKKIVLIVFVDVSPDNGFDLASLQGVLVFLRGVIPNVFERYVWGLWEMGGDWFRGG